MNCASNLQRAVSAFLNLAPLDIEAVGTFRYARVKQVEGCAVIGNPLRWNMGSETGFRHPPIFDVGNRCPRPPRMRRVKQAKVANCAEDFRWPTNATSPVANSSSASNAPGRD